MKVSGFLSGGDQVGSCSSTVTLDFRRPPVWRDESSLLVGLNIRKTGSYVKRNRLLPTLSFSLPATRVNPLRGFIMPPLRVTRIEVRPDMDTPPFKLRQPNTEALGPMKPLQGPTPIAGEK
jgi:hypothetical protein